jgi:hypothetical protein
LAAPAHKRKLKLVANVTEGRVEAQLSGVGWCVFKVLNGVRNPVTRGFVQLGLSEAVTEAFRVVVSNRKLADAKWSSCYDGFECLVVGVLNSPAADVTWMIFAVKKQSVVWRLG